MKKEFSKHWIGSKQKRKQRKYRANAPIHIRRKMMGGNLSKPLRQKYERRSIIVRKGDNVKVMRGKFKGKTGKINMVSLQDLRISIEGLQIQKKDGTKVNVYFKPSNIQIQELDLSDKKRLRVKKEIKVEAKSKLGGAPNGVPPRTKLGGKNASEKTKSA